MKREVAKASNCQTIWGISAEYVRVNRANQTHTVEWHQLLSPASDRCAQLLGAVRFESGKIRGDDDTPGSVSDAS